MPTPMTQSEFLSAHGSACPYCRGDDIDDQDYTWAGRHLVIDQACMDCNAEWQVIALLTEYTNLETES